MILELNKFVTGAWWERKRARQRCRAAKTALLKEIDSPSFVSVTINERAVYPIVRPGSVNTLQKKCTFVAEEMLASHVFEKVLRTELTTITQIHFILYHRPEELKPDSFFQTSMLHSASASRTHCGTHVPAG